jgi:hypothetical protein
MDNCVKFAPITAIYAKKPTIFAKLINPVVIHACVLDLIALQSHFLPVLGVSLSRGAFDGRSKSRFRSVAYLSR